MKLGTLTAASKPSNWALDLLGLIILFNSIIPVLLGIVCGISIKIELTEEE